ncbi:MAG TPA: alpha/beta fold hydrolase [Gemmatimonadaceae bacterium]|nr:alpha/beta fold hydrolase [Gemmatimonadaceae bacterium]
MLCLPYAGGGVSVFHGWSDALPAGLALWPVQLPGREDRIGDAPFSRIGPLVEALGDVVHAHVRQPFALFGHSMGALIAFELARHLRRRFGVQPVRLFVSGYVAPHLPARSAPVHDLPEDAFLDHVRRLNGTSEAVLANPEIRRLIVSVLRADLALCETFAYTADEPLGCAISAFGGLEDPEVRRADLLAWRMHTSRDFTLRMFAGDHFFLRAARRTLLEAMRADLASEVCSCTPGTSPTGAAHASDGSVR